MAMTSTEIRRDLATLSMLIAMFESADPLEADDAEELWWACAQWRALSALLESRRVQCRHKVVSLMAWCGCESAADAARGRADVQRVGVLR